MDSGPVSLSSTLINLWTTSFKNEIHRGSLSTIYSGLILPPEGNVEGRRVAVKKVNIGSAVDAHTTVDQSINAEILQFIGKEIDEMAPFHHENIIRLMGYYLPPAEALSTSDKNMREVCLVLEYAPFGGLNSVLKDSEKAAKLKWHSRLKIATGVAKGLQYMHSGITNAPVYHRDIKSGHIALMADYTPKIIDVEYNSMLSPCTFQSRTLEYMCPDYRLGNVITYDAKCEVFSFGIVLLELLTGQLQGCINEHGKQVMLDALVQENRSLSADDRVQWPADLVNDFLTLARECVAPYQIRIGSMTTVMHRLEAMSNKHHTPSTIEMDLVEQNNLLLARLAALELRADIKAMQAVETTYTCISCLDEDIPASKGAVCSNCTSPHFYCGVEKNNCLGNMLLSQSNDITHFARNSCEVVCACCVALTPKVLSTFDVSIIARQSDREALDTYIRTITDVERQQGELATEKLRSEHVVEIAKLNEAYANGRTSRLKSLTERHRKHIIENIMTLLCPHCNMVIFDFINCFAVKHESDHPTIKYGCGLYFCGWCLAKSDNSSDCHTHVRACKHSMNPGNAYGNFPVDFDLAHARRRSEAILKYLKANISDQQDRVEVHTALQQELNDLGVNIGNPWS